MIHEASCKHNNEDNPTESVPVIALLTESLNRLYQSNIWIGVSDEAVRRGYTLICYAGGSLNASPWDPYEPQRNIIYNLINLKHLKGIIISGSLGNFISPDEFNQFYSRFNDIPMVCLGPGIETIPTIIVDNRKGTEELITHLVENHSCRKIAFLRGPEGNQEAEQRLEIFCDVLKKHGIEPDPGLILSGDFSRDSGAKAANTLLNQRGLSFDALVGANDDMALGALKALQERHIRVPDEVMIAGFDDIEESNFSAPPLTTVRQPFSEMGSKAVECLIRLIEGKEIPAKIIVPAKVVVRQSCGCFRQGLIRSRHFEEVTEFSDEIRNKLFVEIYKIVEQLKMNAESSIDKSLIDRFVNAFINEISGTKGERFVSLVNKTAWVLALTGGDCPGLFRIIAIMRQLASSYFKGNIPDNIEELFQNANITISDAAARAQAHRRLDAERKSTLLRTAGQAIASAFNLEHLFEVIANELNKLEISNCWVSLYRNKSRSFSKLDLVLKIDHGTRVELEKQRTKFKQPDLFPEGSEFMPVSSSLLVEPLFFRDDQLGIIIFEICKCRDGSTYEILRQHISSALKGALLMKKVQEQALALESANQQLQKLRDAEHAYLEAIKHELELGREIQATFLPRELPCIDGWEVFPAFQPAREVSGDFYDVFTLPGGEIVMVLSDVSGKDVGAALFMGMIRTLIRALAEQAFYGASHPLDAVTLTNKYLINHHYGNNGRYMYATLFMAILDPKKNSIMYVNAGHNPPAVVKPDGGVRKWIDTTGPAVGIIPDGQFAFKELELAPGEMLFTYTDGVTEARSPDGTLFSKERLSKLLDPPSLSANELVQRVDDAVKEHGAGNPPYDDITMLALRRSG